jgi:putative DNA methylase
MALKPFEWKDKPALIEHLFPVQKISAESFKEQSAVQSKTLTALGSYWKGRKPLILNKACILGSLLPATDNRLKDLEIFELLMGMDSESMQKRLEEKLPVSKRDAVGELLVLPYNEQVKNAKRPEEIGDYLFIH